MRTRIITAAVALFVTGFGLGLVLPASASPNAPTKAQVSHAASTHRLPSWLTFTPTRDAGGCGNVRVVGTGWHSASVLFCQDGAIHFNGQLNGSVNLSR